MNTNATHPESPANILSLEEENLEVSARHARSSPLAMFITLGIIANLIYQYSTGFEWLVWLVAVSSVLAIRFWVFNYLFEQVAFSIKTRVNIALALSLVHGSAHASSLIFFPDFSEIQRALISLILAGFCLQATATGGDIRQYLCFSLPIMPTIAIMWTTGGTFTLQTFEATLLGLSIAMFYLQQIYIAKSNDAKSIASHESRTELARLNDELQTALQAADVANRAKTRFLASASHDLRQPIHALSLFSAALVRQDLPDQARDVAGHINESVTVLSDQLDALLDLSKLDAGIIQPNLEPVDIQPFLQRIGREFEQQAADKGLQLQLQLDTGVVVDTDVILLERVIRNLLNNAVRYTDQGSITIYSTCEQNRCTIQIQDTGKGISAGEQNRIFDEFYQVSNNKTGGQGLGLGLSIVSRLLKLLSVEIKLDSQIGRGTTITLILERASQGSATTEQASANEGVSLSNLHILVIDDEANIRAGMQQLLTSYGASVSLAPDRQSALEMARTQTPDLVITDLELGEEDGMMVSQEIGLALQTPSLPVILITGNTSAEKLQRATESGLPLMHKPVSADRLLQRIDELTLSAAVT